MCDTLGLGLLPCCLTSLTAARPIAYRHRGAAPRLIRSENLRRPRHRAARGLRGRCS
jgi:hypothetical protein